MSSIGPDLIGWIASIILLATLGRQVYSQWKSGQTQGVSRWLFIGQVTASVGFTLYSWLLHNWVFLFTNIAILVTAVAGEWIYLRNRRRAKGRRDAGAAQAAALDGRIESQRMEARSAAAEGKCHDETGRPAAA